MNQPKLSEETFLSSSVLFGVLGKMLYQELGREELDQILKDQLFAEVPFGEEQEETKRGIALLSKWTEENSGGLSQEAIEDIRHDFLYLFTGVGHPLASPWESTYFNDNRMTFEKQTLEVRGWYKQFGLMIERKNKEPDDNIGYELSFIAHLAHLGAEAAESGDNESLGVLTQAMGDFLSEHPLRWAFVWSDRVQKNARSGFYHGIALLVSGCLKALSLELEIDLNAIRQCALA